MFSDSPMHIDLVAYTVIAHISSLFCRDSFNETRRTSQSFHGGKRFFSSHPQNENGVRLVRFDLHENSTYIFCLQESPKTINNSFIKIKKKTTGTFY